MNPLETSRQRTRRSLVGCTRIHVNLTILCLGDEAVFAFLCLPWSAVAQTAMHLNVGMW